MRIDSKRLLYASFFPLLFIIFLWIIHIFQWESHANWANLGIYPRTNHGLLGIITGPLIHANFKHLFSNTVPLLILGWCLFYFYKDLSYLVFPILWVGTGFITWCIGRESWHIGASGLVYGMSFFLFFSGIFRKHIPLMAISLLVAFLYGSIVFNMLPVSELVNSDISWEGHLSGGFTGLLAAVIFRNNGPQKPESLLDEETGEEEENILNFPETWQGSLRISEYLARTAEFHAQE